MDGLGTVRPEIHAFVSRENRSHGDKWLQQAEWVENERTLKLRIRKPPEGGHDAGDGQGVLGTLIAPSLLSIYFPASLDGKPFCFCEDDTFVPAAEAANDRLLPLSRNSVLAVVTTVLQCVKREAPIAETRTSSRGSDGDARALMAAEAVLAAIQEDPLGADLVLALLSMAVSSYRRDTVSTPFPMQLESAGCKRAYTAFVASLEGIPAVSRMSAWSDAKQLLALPPVALLALHFVLVGLSTQLRTLKPADSTSATSTSISASGDGPGSRASLLPAAGGGGRGTGKRDRTGGVSGAGRGDRIGVGTGQLGSVPSHVFDVVLPSDPAFDNEAKTGGCDMAYHGSSPENFHSILNTGLRVMSGSRLMKNGAAFGEGIYLSGSQKAAAVFAERGDGSGTTVWPRSAFGGENRKFRHRLVAKCRVLKGAGVKKIEGWGDEETYYIVHDESRVQVVGLLLFDAGLAPEASTVEAARASKRAFVSGSMNGHPSKEDAARKGSEAGSTLRSRTARGYRDPEREMNEVSLSQWNAVGFWQLCVTVAIVISGLALCLALSANSSLFPNSKRA